MIGQNAYFMCTDSLFVLQRMIKKALYIKDTVSLIIIKTCLAPNTKYGTFADQIKFTYVTLTLAPLIK